MSAAKYKVMCLCKDGTKHSLTNGVWVDAYHVVWWVSYDDGLAAALDALRYNLRSQSNEIWWVTHGNPYSRELPEVVEKHIAERGIYVRR